MGKIVEIADFDFWMILERGWFRPRVRYKEFVLYRNHKGEFEGRSDTILQRQVMGS